MPSEYFFPVLALRKKNTSEIFHASRSQFPTAIVQRWDDVPNFLPRRSRFQDPSLRLVILPREFLKLSSVESGRVFPKTPQLNENYKAVIELGKFQSDARQRDSVHYKFR